MNLIFQALRRAGGDLWLPRVLSLVFLPMLVALTLWGGLAWWFGATWLTGVETLLGGIAWPDWMSGLVTSSVAGGITGVLAYGLLALLLLPAIYVTALLITAVVFMPVLVAVVAGRHYPGLERRRGGSFLGSLGNGLAALLIYGLVWLLTLPFWLLGPLGVAVSVVLNAWLNQRLFIYDALADHASADELRLIRQQVGWPLYLLSGLLGLLHWVPVLNFVAPVYMALAFTHYGLEQLQRQRREGGA